MQISQGAELTSVFGDKAQAAVCKCKLTYPIIAGKRGRTFTVSREDVCLFTNGGTPRSGIYAASPVYWSVSRFAELCCENSDRGRRD